MKDEKEAQGVKAILALQGFANVDEAKEKALRGWRAMTEWEKKSTLRTYKDLFGESGATKKVSPEGLDLTDKVVIVNEEYGGDEVARKFLCKDGFGCMPFLTGNAIMGNWVASGRIDRIERYQVECVEVAADAAVEKEES